MNYHKEQLSILPIVYLYELSQRTTINSSYSLSTTEKRFYFRSEDISVWRRKVKLFMIYNFRVTVYIFMAEVTSRVQMFSPCRRVFMTGRKSVREIQTRNIARQMYSVIVRVFFRRMQGIAVPGLPFSRSLILFMYYLSERLDV